MTTVRQLVLHETDRALAWAPFFSLTSSVRSPRRDATDSSSNLSQCFTQYFQLPQERKKMKTHSESISYGLKPVSKAIFLCITDLMNRFRTAFICCNNCCIWPSAKSSNSKTGDHSSLCPPKNLLVVHISSEVYCSKSGHITATKTSTTLCRMGGHSVFYRQ